MTLVLLWYMQRDERWHALADSRLSGADNPLLDSAPKVLTLPVSVYLPPENTTKPFKRILNTTVGFAYAGSSMSGMSTYAFAATACQYLAMLDYNRPLPTLRHIAELVGKISTHYISEIASRFHPHQRRGAAEFFIFGYCNGTRKPLAFSIKPTFEPSFSMEVVELPAGPQMAVYALGDRDVRNAYFAQLDREVYLPEDQRRSFAEILDSLIASNTHPQIGGTVQEVVADKSGAWVLPVLDAPEGELGSGHATFLNIDLDDLGPVGDCRIGMQVKLRIGRKNKN